MNENKLLKAAIFDLDGVITDTAILHFKAWKEIFDDFLNSYNQQQQISQPEFSYNDYLTYVDGLPRHDGIRNFLNSRNIAFTEKNKKLSTIKKLADQKNNIFNRIISEQPIPVFNATLSFIQDLRQLNFKIAVVSSSKNCTTIINKLKISDLFDSKVDGNDSERLNLPGKPDPAIFLTAIKQLDLHPQQGLLIEDATAGVSAGKAGKFQCVIGIAHDNNHKKELKKAGADIVVNDLSEFPLTHLYSPPLHSLPIFSHLNTIKHYLTKNKLLLFLDYDGTLTPIVSRPELATLSPAMRGLLQQIATFITTTIISGRQLQDVKSLVALDGLYYAGNHGFEIENLQHEVINKLADNQYQISLKNVYKKLQEKIGQIENIIIENKELSLSIHYRLVDKNQVDIISSNIDQVIAEYSCLKKHAGKKVYEIRPNIAWDKGKALRWVWQNIADKNTNQYTPIYIGDDTTDEDAFAAIAKNGISILVAEHDQPTKAKFRLSNVDQVQQFLQQLLELLSK